MNDATATILYLLAALALGLGAIKGVEAAILFVAARKASRRIYSLVDTTAETAYQHGLAHTGSEAEASKFAIWYINTMLVPVAHSLVTVMPVDLAWKLWIERRTNAN